MKGQTHIRMDEGYSYSTSGDFPGIPRLVGTAAQIDMIIHCMNFPLGRSSF